MTCSNNEELTVVERGGCSDAIGNKKGTEICGRHRRSRRHEHFILCVGILTCLFAAGLLFDWFWPSWASGAGREMIRKQQSTRTRFVILIGLEGTGHHLYGSVYNGSPPMRILSESKVQALYRAFQKHIWLTFNAPFSDGNSDVNWTEVLNTMVQSLAEIDSTVQQIVSSKNSSSGIVSVPFNGIRNFGAKYLSYPTGYSKGEYQRSLRYPDLDVFYKACDKAGVTCQHVLVHRNAYEVIRSTTMNRHFGPRKVQIKMYSTMLDIIRAQLLDHPDRLASCWDYNTGEGILEVGRLFGWEDGDEFMDFYTGIYQPHEALTNTERLKIVPPELEVFMEEMVHKTGKVVELCKKQMIQAKE